MREFESKQVEWLFKDDPSDLEEECIVRMKREFPASLGNPAYWELTRDTVINERAARERFGRLPMAVVRKSSVIDLAAKIGASQQFVQVLLAEVTAAEVAAAFGGQR